MNFVNLKRMFSTRHISIPDEWLTECIDWLQENQEPNINLEQEVYAQWLASDLTQLSQISLPANLRNQLKTVLHGYHVLQLNSVVDVSKPSYQQLTKLKGTDISNSEVTGDRLFEAKVRAAPKRLLMLDLTDGTQAIKGMEYQYIPDLNTNLPPGSKILVFGEIPCRMGVLLLKKDNVKLLGGGVEELTEAFSQVKVLENRLASENHERHPNLSTAGNRQQLPPAQDTKDNLPSTKQNLHALTVQQLPVPQRKTKLSLMASTDFDDDDPFDKDISDLDDSLFQNLDLENLSSGQEDDLKIKQPSTSTVIADPVVSIASSNNRRNSNYEPLPKRLMTNRNFTLPKSSLLLTNADGNDDDDVFNDDMDDDFIDLDLTEPQPNHSAKKHSVHKSTSSETKPQNVVGSSRDRSSAASRAALDNNSHHTNSERCLPSVGNVAADTPIRNKSYSGGGRVDDTSWDMDDGMDDYFLDEKLNTVECGSSKSKNLQSTSNAAQIPLGGNDRGDHGQSRMNSGTAAKTQTSGTKSVSANVASITDVNVILVDKTPFSYLCQMPELPCRSTHNLRIKGFIMTIWNNLSRQNNEWSLEVEINDGSASVAAILTNKVLVELIGMTVEESLQMKTASRRDPELKKKYKQIFQESSERFNRLSCLMDLEILPDSQLPNVVSIQEVNSETLRHLIMRAYL